MRKRTLAVALLVSVLAVANRSMAEEPTAMPAGLAPVLVQTIAAKDVPASEPVPEWNAKWKSYLAWVTDIAYLDQWVYVMSTRNGYYLRFERDPATAKLQFREAIEMHRHSKGPTWGSLQTRRLPDGSGVLYATYGTEGDGPREDSMRWFQVDAKTGALTLIGKKEPSFPPMPGPYGYAAIVWNPDRSRWYKAFVENMIWYNFKEDGTPVEGGSVACKNRTRCEGIRPRPHALFSPDAKQLYMLVEKTQMTHGAYWQVDQYDVDAKTGTPTYVASLDLPDVAVRNGVWIRAWVVFLDFAPDGRYVYVSDADAGNPGTQSVVILRRDVEKGTLSIASRQEDPRFVGLSGAGWDPRGTFQFNADGRGGYFTSNRNRQLCAFTCDPATGALTVFRVGPASGMLALDAVNGNLFLGGGSIASYKTPAGARAPDTK